MQVRLQVTAGPGFTLAVASKSLSITAAGQSATDVVTLSSTGGFAGTVALSCAVAPVPTSGKAATCIVPGNLVVSAGAPASATLQVATDSTTPAGTYTATITSVSGLVQQSVSASFTLSQMTPTPTFQLSAASGAVSIAAAGESVTDTLTISPSGGFTGTVQLSCAVTAPSPTSAAAPTCTVPSAAPVAGGSVVTAILTVNTTAPSAMLSPDAGGVFARRVGGAALGCLFLFLVPRRRRGIALGVLLLSLSGLALTGCAGSTSSSTTPPVGSPGTPAGTYSVMVTATSGSITNTTQIQVNVQ